MLHIAVYNALKLCGYQVSKQCAAADIRVFITNFYYFSYSVRRI